MKKIFFLLFFVFNFETLYAENTFAYININHILNNSIVGQSITEHINKIKEIKLKEFESTEKKINRKGTKYS